VTKERRFLGGSVTLLALLLWVSGCGNDRTSASPQKGATPAQQSLTITVAPVEARTVQRTVETTGSLLAW